MLVAYIWNHPRELRVAGSLAGCAFNSLAKLPFLNHSGYSSHLLSLHLYPYPLPPPFHVETPYMIDKYCSCPSPVLHSGTRGIDITLGAQKTPPRRHFVHMRAEMRVDCKQICYR